MKAFLFSSYFLKIYLNFSFQLSAIFTAYYSASSLAFTRAHLAEISFLGICISLFKCQLNIHLTYFFPPKLWIEDYWGLYEGTDMCWFEIFALISLFAVSPMSFFT